MSVARVLIADAPIPSPGYGSWSQRITYLLEQYPGNVVDYVVGNNGADAFHSARTKRYNLQLRHNRLMNRLLKHWKLQAYKTALQEIAAQHEQLIICIVDSIRTKHAVWHFLGQMNIRHKCKIIYYQCGYSTYLSSDKYEALMEGVDEVIYLSKHSYLYELEHNPSLPFTAHVLHNPIDNNRCYPLAPAAKQALRQQLGMDNGCQFVWSSQHRKKKGLEVILNAWQLLDCKALNATLHVVGADTGEQIPGVVFHGRQPNHEVHRYLQAADIGLFSPLWTEGFGLSLAEQMSCGLYCISSWVGGVKDYFDAARFGEAIETPNMPAAWAAAMQRAVEKVSGFQSPALQGPVFLTYDEWCERFCDLLA